MMTKARKDIVDLNLTPFYHCIGHCVGNLYLCGQHQATNQNFDHRREWLIDKVKHLAEYFAIDVCAYAIMHNHYHLVLKVDQDQSKSFSDDEVISRWRSVGKADNAVIDKFISGEASDAEKCVALEIIQEWRIRLANISWFMRKLNEYMARRANREMERRGKFWEARFVSQALLDETAVLCCMAYVDLNPIRARIANNLEDSHFTSIKERIQAFAAAMNVNNKPVQDQSEARKVEDDLRQHRSKISAQQANQQQSVITPSFFKQPPLKQVVSKPDFLKQCQPAWLLPFSNGKSHNEWQSDAKIENNIHFSLIDYLELVDWTGRRIRKDKRGFIAQNQPKVIERLQIDKVRWMELTQNFKKEFADFAGTCETLTEYADEHQCRLNKGIVKSHRT